MAETRETEHFKTSAFVARLQASDKDAVRQVVKAYLPHILRAALGAGLSRERADDITQETFRTFMETLSRFEGRSHVRTWLFGILYLKLKENWRDQSREDRAEDIDEIMESRFNEKGMWSSPPRTPDMDVYDQEISKFIEICMEELGGNQRVAFMMREVEGLETREICNAMDVSVTNLGVILYRARNSLRECLERKGLSA